MGGRSPYPMRSRLLFLTVGYLATFLIPGAAAAAAATPKLEVVEVRKIWDRGEHNAFTDLVRWRERWWCVFRESEAHVGGDGGIRVLESADGRSWTSVALLTERDIDLRDPKLSVMPDGRLMLNCGGSVYLGTRQLKGRRSRVMFSADGRTWTAPRPILHDGEWLWRVTWHEGVAYGAAYNALVPAKPGAPAPEWTLTIYSSRDGLDWTSVAVLPVDGHPNETTLRFQPDGRMLAWVRREAGDKFGALGVAAPPYREWTWHKGQHRLGGPNMILLPGGTWLASTREYTGAKPGSTQGMRTILAQLDLQAGLTPLATLPSDGDTSYAGLVWHEGMLWVSYYSSHEGKSSIYLAQVRVR